MAQDDSKYTKPGLRKRIFNQVKAGSKGGKPGQWSARKAQLVAQKYKAQGGGYKGGKGKKQKDLKRWGKEKWMTRKEYEKKMMKISNNSKRYTDKLLTNFLLIGFIKLILPESKIIHCLRSPEDNIFSIFKNHFPSGKINFAYNLDEATEYYKLYVDLMEHWNSVLPNFIFNIQ